MRQRLRALMAMAAVVGLLVSLGVGTVAAAATDSRARAKAFTSAAKDFQVPEKLLLAIGYTESRWTPHGDEPSNNNGYGIMNLRAKETKVPDADHGRGLGKPHAATTVKASRYTLNDAASKLNKSGAELKSNDTLNIRGAAAVLAQYAKQLNGGKLPTTLPAWYSAVAAYSGSLTEDQAQRYADTVYDVLRTGVQETTSDGQQLTLTATPEATVENRSVSTLALEPSLAAESTAVDCPVELNCTFTPAAYAANSNTDPTNYGNYDKANRPTDMPIKYIVIHDTEGSYSGTISWIQNSSSYVSSHYVIRSSDGAVTEMVRPNDVAWGAGNWHTNMHSINIEHEGYAEQGATWYTENMYRSSAALVRYLAQQYGIPLDRQHILGHTEVPTLNGSAMAGQHWDPGPYWDWNHYMDLILGTTQSGDAVTATTGVATIQPVFASNKPVITGCARGKQCASQGANIVYLRTQPNATAPLLSDKYKASKRFPNGTTAINDYSATATAGNQFAVAGVSGAWTAVWYGGQKGWFYNPTGAGQTAVAATGTVVVPKAGVTAVNVYGGAYPESSEYPAGIPPYLLSPLYTFGTGQAYPITDQAPNDYYYAPTYNYSKPGDHTVVVGGEVYYRINFNHRVGYVRASQVDLVAR